MEKIMAVKVPKNKDKNKDKSLNQEEKRKGRFFNEELMEEVAAVAEAEWETPEAAAIIQPAVIQSQTLQQPERVGAGRPKVQRRIERGKAMNVFFDENTHQLLKNMKFYHDVEMKEIPYVLTREFFKKYEMDGKLSQEGLAYLQKLLAEVN